MALSQRVKIRKRIGGAAGAPGAGVLEEGELAYNDSGDTLHIGNGGGAVRVLVSETRQVQIAGAQTITGTKTIDIANLHINGGTAGDVIGTDGAGNLSFGPGAVVVDDPITGVGTSGDPLTVTPATSAQIITGTDDVFPVTSAGLRSQLGAAVSTLATTTKNVVGAINDLHTAIGSMSGALEFVGTYDAATDAITPKAGGPAAAGALPAAATANEGWFLVVNVAGTGTGNAPAVSLSNGDWLLSDGANWSHIDMGMSAVSASIVSFSAVAGMTATDVQSAIAELHTNKLATVAVDGTSITGTGATGSALSIATIDGGTF